MAATRQHGTSYTKGHQRRQSVARLLPDISKLRLLSWLVEASNELINCDIAIMDGVYAKLNRSRESLLFWQQNHYHHHRQQTTTTPIATSGVGSRSSCGQLSVTPLSRHHQAMAAPPLPPPPPPPSKQPVSGVGCNKIVISQHQQNKLQKKLSLNSASNKLSIKSSNLITSSSPTTSDSKKHKNKRNSGTATTSAAASTSSSAAAAAARNHHSLPMTNYDASSLAAISLRSTKTMPASSTSDNKSLMFDSRSTCSHQPGDLSATVVNSRLKVPTSSTCDHHPTGVNDINTRTNHNHNSSQRNYNCDTSDDDDDEDNLGDDEDDEDDDNEVEDEDHDDLEEEDDDNNSTSSSGTTSTSSSGIHGNSLSSSSGSDSSASSSSSSFGHNLETSSTMTGSNIANKNGTPATGGRFNLSPAEYLSDRIRQVLMEHQHLQSLLVNVIRQHDRQRDSICNRRSPSQLVTNKIDLADIASSLDDGCLCSCHSEQTGSRSNSTSRASTLPLSTFSSTTSNTSGGTSSQTTTPTRSKATTIAARRLKKIRGGSAASSGEPSRDEMIQQMADRLCENCFETHQWLLGCSTIELTTTSGGSSSSSKHRTGQDDNQSSASPVVSDKQLDADREHLEAMIGLRNATFIKLVQQQVRSTISKSIELIDLIRKEIKSPESIKQKQLMFSFSSSIQLLTSVANYVVPSQDISSFIPEVPGHYNHHHQQQQQPTKLFSLPTSDFDHLLMYQPSSAMIFPPLGGGGNPALAASSASDAGQYHLAQVPEIPPRRRAGILGTTTTTTHMGRRQTTAALMLDTTTTTNSSDAAEPQSLPAAIGSSSSGASMLSAGAKHSLTGSGECLASNMQRLRTTEEVVATTTTGANNNHTNIESSSGASSNNSSASSSIARSQVQQSSLTRAHTSSSMILRDVERLGSNSLGGSSSITANSSPYQTSNGISINSRGHQTELMKQQQQQRHNITFDTIAASLRSANAPTTGRPHHRHQDEDLMFLFNTGGKHGGSPKFWQSSKFNFIKKLLHVKQQRLLRQQSKDRRIYNNKVQNKFRLVMMDLTHFNKSQQLLTTENGVNSLLTSMRNVLEFGLYLTVKLY